MGLIAYVVPANLVGSGSAITLSDRYNVPEEFRATVGVFVYDAAGGPLNDVEGQSIIDAAIYATGDDGEYLVPQPGDQVSDGLDELFLEERHASITMLGNRQNSEGDVITGAWVDIQLIYRFQRFVDAEHDRFPLLVDSGGAYEQYDSHADITGVPIFVAKGEHTDQSPTVPLNRTVPFAVYEWVEEVDSPVARSLYFADKVNDGDWSSITVTVNGDPQGDKGCWHVASIESFPLITIPVLENDESTVRNPRRYKFRVKLEYRSNVVKPSFTGSEEVQLGWNAEAYWTYNGWIPNPNPIGGSPVTVPSTVYFESIANGDDDRGVCTHHAIDFSFFGDAP